VTAVTNTLERYRWLIVGLLSIPLIAGLVSYATDRVSDDPPALVVEPGNEAPPDIRVFVAGAVTNPGVYPLPESARWIDAIEAAGGLAVDAEVTAVNMARRVEDEDQIIVPAVGDASSPPAAAAGGQPINLNTASVEELEALPGIGEVRAEAIVDSRTDDGPFTQVEDLLLRELIPESVYEEIAPLVSVD
jgi:competence protein ComEA